MPASQKNQFAKTNAQKKWAVKTRPVGREAHILPRYGRPRKHLTCPQRLFMALAAPATALTDEFGLSRPNPEIH
ncbi:MAG: hypothetical protein Q8S56_11325 [Polaromonas sp.]|nr:hypothetical protein [Polaromonas sp.]